MADTVHSMDPKLNGTAQQYIKQHAHIHAHTQADTHTHTHTD